jgi:nucleoside-diphosphate-sugar epimerase
MSTIFVTGATGVLGRATLPLLLAAGHSVRALARSEANDAAIRALGGEPVDADLFDLTSLRVALAGADAVLHLATSIPTDVRPRQAWCVNDRIRADGARNLVDAAIAAGVATFVYPSFAMLYPESGNRWVDAASTPPDPAPILRSTLEAEAQVARFAASGPDRRGVSLRMGGFYGSGLPSTEAMLALARRGVAQAFGPPDAFTPMVWIDDAATAVVAALERAPSGVYDVTDDEPLPRGEVAREVARVVGRSRLLLPPRWLAGFAAGAAAWPFVNSQRVSNRRFTAATGWVPAVPHARAGMAMLTERAATAQPVPAVAGRSAPALLLWLLVALLLSAGLWQLVFPEHFYREFPGFGRAWVSTDGPYNEHLMRDFGSANLALGLIGLGLAWRPTTYAVRVFAAAAFVAQTAHFVYHAAHLDLLPTATDRVLQTLSLALAAIVPALLLLIAGWIEAPAASASKTAPAGDARGHLGSAKDVAEQRM